MDGVVGVWMALFSAETLKEPHPNLTHTNYDTHKHNDIYFDGGRVMLILEHIGLIKN